MKIDYDNSLYFELSNRPSLESEEVQPGIVFDFDNKGSVVGIDIEHASEFVDVQKFEVPETA